MGWFNSLSKTEPADGPSDYQKVLSLLAECQMEIQAAERERDQVSLAIALGNIEDAGKDVLDRLAALREKETLLQAAMRQAEAAERANIGRLGAREHEARKRSLSQKSGQLRRDQQRFTAAAIEYRDSYRAMVGTAASIAALLPNQLRDSYEGMLSQGAIKKLCEVESYRVSADGLPCPGVQHKPLYSDEIPPLAETIEQRISNLKEGLEQAGPVLAGQAVRPQSGMLLSVPEPQPADYSVDMTGKNPKTGEAKPAEPAEPIMMETANA